MIRAVCEKVTEELPLQSKHTFACDAAEDSLKLKRLGELAQELMQDNFTICVEHFGNGKEKRQDKAAAATVTAAVPVESPTDAQLTHEDVSLQANESEDNMDIVGPTIVNLSLIQVQPHNPSVKMCRSSHSSTSTNNTDICILDAHESHYSCERDEDDEYCERLERSFDAPDFTFTLLHAPQRKEKHACAFDESTEVLLLHCDDCNGKQSQNNSGTDSDVEVLMSEEINDSDWSEGLPAASADVALEALLRQAHKDATSPGSSDDAVVAVPKTPPASSSTSASVKQQGSTDQDISVEFSDNCSVDSCEQLSRTQLINVIHNQAERIRQLEATLHRYRSAQQTLFEHVDAMRAELEPNAFQKSHETIHLD